MLMPTCALSDIPLRMHKYRVAAEDQQVAARFCFFASARARGVTRVSRAFINAARNNRHLPNATPSFRARASSNNGYGPHRFPVSPSVNYRARAFYARFLPLREARLIAPTRKRAVRSPRLSGSIPLSLSLSNVVSWD